MPDPRPESRLAGLFVGLGGALLLLAASFANWAYQTSSDSLVADQFKAMHEGPLPGSALGDALIAFGVALVALHLVFGLGCWLLARASRRAWPDYPAGTRTWTVMWLLVIVFWVLIANAALYPRSVFGDNLYVFAQAQWLGISVFHALTAAVAAAAALPFGILARRRLASRRDTGRSRSVPWVATGAAVMVVSGMGVVSYSGQRTPAPQAAPQRPHVILIGLDSLRCDATGIDGDPTLTPHVDAFLEASRRFTDTLTPLARTYPSWVSILTGKNPHSTGAIVNLIHKDQLRLGDTLPLAMRRAGYRTAYAIDETRFSNIDASYGFDQTVTPPIGAADFAIGLISDTPLGNLVTNTRLGQWLFPYGHANRGAAVTYDPDTFVERLDRELDFSRPTFLALHLTLAHWPYAWADSTRAEIRDEENWTAAHYRPAVRRLDQQFAQVLEVLERKGALDDAIVVVLSDHGEAVGLPDDSPWAMTGPEEDPYAKSVITGHGTSVLSPHQYRVLLAVRGFGTARSALAAPGAIDAPASLEDIAPTLDQWLGLDMPAQFDGRSLLPLLRGAPEATLAMQDRVRFIETEFNPRGFMPHEKQTPSAVANAMRSYEIDRESGRMYIRRQKHTLLLRQRQYAAVLGQEMVAAIPGVYTRGMRYIYLDPARRQFPVALDGPPDPALGPNARVLWNALQQQYGTALALSGRPVPVGGG